MNLARFYVKELKSEANNSGSIKVTMLDLSIYITDVYWQKNKNVVDCNWMEIPDYQSNGINLYLTFSI